MLGLQSLPIFNIWFARALGIALILSACFLAVGVLSAQGPRPEPAVLETSEPRDFVEYWAAARLFAQNGNPYSPAELLALERSAGWRGAQPLIMWNPPWVLPLLLPFGYLSFTAGQFVWLLLHVCALVIAARCLWEIYDAGSKPARISWLVTLTFVPAVFVLVIGQITPLVVVGGAWFLYALRERRYGSASVALVLVSLKPHLLYLFWIVLALWLWEKRLWVLARSGLIVGIAAALLPLLFDAQIYSKYFALYDHPGIPKPLDWPVPTLRNVLRVFLGIEQPWLQFAPTAIAAVWVVAYWRRHKNTWRWDEQLPLLTLVSIASGFFVWTYDHVVVLPALCQAAARIAGSPLPWHRLRAVRLYLAVNGLHGLLRFWLPEELWYFWLAPTLWINYLIFRRELSLGHGDCARRPAE